MSKTRIIWKQGVNTIFPGASALAQLRAIAKANYIELPLLTGPRWKYAVELERKLRAARLLGNNSQLLIYREPRKTRAKNSRYRQMMNTLFGIVARPTPPRGGRGDVRPRPTAHPPKPKRPSRTVNLLEQELLRKGDDF